MNKYKVIKTVTLTVEPDSQVILSDRQYQHVKHCLEPITKGKSLSNMSVAELIELAGSKGICIPEGSKKKEIIEFLENQVI